MKMDDFASLDSEETSLSDCIKTIELRNINIRHDITQVRAQIRQVRTRRNACTSFFKLPQDILHVILYMLARLDFYSSIEDISTVEREEPRQWLKDSRDWTHWSRITHVRPYIRSLALTWPRLWADIRLYEHNAWQQLCLGRAGASPLAVTMTDVPEGIAPIKANIVSLDIWSRSFNVYTGTYWDLNVGSIPSLRAFRGGASEHMIDLGTHFLDPSTCANLTRLSLSNVRLRDGVPHFPRLTHLDLCEIQSYDRPARLMQFLEHAPHLKCAYINDIAGPLDNVDGGPASWPRFRHARLERLGISGSTTFVAALLCALGAPVSGYCMVTDNEWQLGSAGVAQLRQRVLRTAAQAFGYGGAMAPVHLSQKWVVSSKGDRTWCLWIEHAASSNYGMTYEDHTDEIDDVFHVLEQAPVLHIHGNAAVTCLVYTVADGCNMLPRLEHLAIEGVACMDLTDLRTCLRARAAAEGPLRTLEFKRCGYIYCWASTYECAGDLGRELMLEGTVDEVLDNALLPTRKLSSMVLSKGVVRPNAREKV